MVSARDHFAQVNEVKEDEMMTNYCGSWRGKKIVTEMTDNLLQSLSQPDLTSNFTWLLLKNAFELTTSCAQKLITNFAKM
mgnify:FL=1